MKFSGPDVGPGTSGYGIQPGSPCGGPSAPAQFSRRDQWPERAQPDFVGGPRDSVFPLPHIRPSEHHDWGAGRQAKRHAWRYDMVGKAANEAIDGLNLLYGCGGTRSADSPALGKAMSSGRQAAVSHAHTSIHQNLTKSIASGIPTSVPTDRAALHEMAGASRSYGGEATTVVPYDVDKVSLPEQQLYPVPLANIATGDLRKSL